MTPRGPTALTILMAAGVGLLLAPVHAVTPHVWRLKQDITRFAETADLQLRPSRLALGRVGSRPSAQADEPVPMPRREAASQSKTPGQLPSGDPPPRILPIDDATASEEQRVILRSSEQAGTGARELRTYAHHPVLAKNVLPFAHYITTASTLPPRHRALLILRTAWLCRSAYTWAHHAKAARRAGVDSGDLERIARGPGAAGWQPFEATLLRVADELHANAFVSDPTWQALSREYDTKRAMDAVFTVAELTMIAGTVNSLRLAIDDDAHDRLPTTIPFRVDVKPTTERLIGTAARITPLETAEWTPEVRAWLERDSTAQGSTGQGSSGQGGTGQRSAGQGTTGQGSATRGGSSRPVAAIYRTYARHLAMDRPRTLVSEHIRVTSTLSARDRELLILRIGWLCRSEYEWAAHAPAGRRAGLTDADFARILALPASQTPSDTSSGATTSLPTIDAHLIRAVDELHRDDMVSDATWAALTTQYDTRQLLDILTTIGGYRMVSMALNTLGVQLEPGAERFPF